MWLIWMGENGFIRIFRIGVLLAPSSGVRYPAVFGGHCLFSLRRHDGGRIRVLGKGSPVHKSRGSAFPFASPARSKARGRYRSFQCGV